MKINYFLVLTFFIITILIRKNVYCSDFESLSYGQDVLSGKVSPTEKPLETTTKKSGFFSGIKNFFGGGKTTTTTTTTASPPPINKNVLTSSTTPLPNRDFIAPTPSNSPFNSNNFNNNKNVGSISSISTSTTTTTKPSDNRRDFVAPVRPSSPTPNNGGIGNNNQFGFNSISTSTTSKPNDNRRDSIVPPPVPPRSPSPQIPHGLPISSSTTTTTTATPNNRRDYVAPSRPSFTPGLPSSSSTHHSGINQPISSTTPSNRRDYVNPNIPNVPYRPISTSTQVPQVISSGPASPNILDDKDFPALGPSRGSGGGGGQKPTPSTGFPTRKPGDRISFVPHTPAGPSKTTNKNQLAKDDELSTLTESLLTKDVNNQNQHVTINLQGKTKSTDRTDEAPDKLLEVQDQALESPTIAKMRLLFNNYEIDTSTNEYVTPIEHKEENDFVDAVMATTVMRTAMQFLQNKGVVTPDPKTHRDFVKTLWFTLYSRGGGRIGSSAFEHVFLNEIKNGTVIGMHNWIYYAEEEKLGHADYKGYIRKVDLGNKGAILKYRFNYNGLEKYANTLFIGTSPELEMALYTICFAVRPDKDCPISLNQQKINIVTHTWRYRGKQLIGSAYPEI